MKQPHDRFFHRVFSDPEHARGELQLLVRPELRKRIDWSTLVTESARFVDPKLHELRSDVLFRVKLHDGRTVYLYLLFEHQSTADRWMPLRVLEYLVAIWNKHLETEPSATLVPGILPFVLHHSERGWTSAVRFSEILDMSPETLELLREFVPDFRFVLDDVSHTKDEEFRSRAELTLLARLALVCLSRTRRNESFMAELRRWKDAAQALVDAPTGVAAIEAVLRYVLESSDTPRPEIEAYVAELGPKAEKALMTTAQVLQAEGKAEGKAERGAELLLKQLTRKFGSVPTSVTERVQQAESTEIDDWAERILDAKSIDEVFG